MLYKIISKVLVNFQKPLMGSIISEFQSAFVSDRLLTDNALIAFETCHYINSMCKSGVGALTIKLDMTKAYDRAELSFLMAVMLTLGFLVFWVNLVMSCVEFASFVALINRSLSVTFWPT